ncbi:MAG TPA: CoA transferase [Dehalococcoidia bacterium]|jgi:crotonobetainyl-CoA:carnitine CoA-transferase CaiB-like acyl-CoA transferase
MPGPLTGLRIFDLTVWMVGPWASMQLGSMGADVIHIEQPGVLWSSLGAGVPPTIDGTSIGYITWNMNKRGLFLDLKSTRDRATACELLQSCDAFLINMRPGVAERLGLGYETVHEINPRIVYCSVTGWGESGPMAERPGADTQVQYVSGFWSANGRRGGEREIYRHFTQMDATTGNYAAQAILMALLARRRTGSGQKVEVPMIRAAAALQTARLAEYLATGELHQPLGSAAYATAPDQCFPCEDQQWVGVSVTSEDEWRAFCAAIERPELATDPRFCTNGERVCHRDELAALLEPLFRAKPQFYWMMRLTSANVPCGYPLRFDVLRHHRQAVENEYLLEVETSAWGRVWTGGPPWHFSRTPATWRGTPMPGEHTGEILDELERRPDMAPALRQA